MALLDFLKRKKEVEKNREKKETSKTKPEQKTDAALQTKQTKTEKPIPKKEIAEKFSYEIVKEPHISEKSTNLGAKNKYVFKVYTNANKPEIKKSVQAIYGVDVLSVNIIKIPKKKRRIGRTEGFKKGYQKAIVTVKEGQKIEFF